jgi:hypothetical protein
MPSIFAMILSVFKNNVSQEEYCFQTGFVNADPSIAVVSVESFVVIRQFTCDEESVDDGYILIEKTSFDDEIEEIC